MDALVELLPLLFIAAYYLLASRRRAKLKRQQANRSTAPQEELVSAQTPEESPFQQFLRQLEEAAAEAAGVEEPAAGALPPTAPDRAEVVPAAPVVERPLPRLGSEFSAPPGSFESAQATDHERHGFGAENPYSEEAFERAPAFGARRRRTDRDYDPHELHQRPERVRELGPDWRKQLRDPKAAREAFVLQTIFGPRGGRRSENR